MRLSLAAAALALLPACFLFEPVGPPPSSPEPLPPAAAASPPASAWTPRRDSDGDGIDDATDQCPEAPEDRDLFQDEDGCPDPDNDRDGILDRCDRCPNEPEVYNGVDDEDGCPDAHRIRLQSERISIVQRTHFAQGQARFSQASLPVIDAVAAVLKAHPDIEVIALVGHASSDEQRPDLLSLRRAQEVRAALIQRGVDADRLTPLAAGNRSPLADNKTTEGREQNRRVEFHILAMNGAEIARWDGARLVSLDPPPPPPPPPRPVIPGCP